MRRRSEPMGLMLGFAALARIEELTDASRSRQGMTAMSTTNADSAARALWAAGDYHRFAKATVWELGPRLVEACGIRAGQRVLDVACGTGNVAIRAAQAGAEVVASDLTPEHFEAGKAEAAAQGVQLDWVAADAQQLPFEDGSFDVVTSAVGAIFAPDHQRVADELLRLCRPGGVIGMINFAPEGVGADFFTTLGTYLPPPPPGALPPLLWGSEDHVRELFGDRVARLDMEHDSYVERAASPDEYVRLFTRTFGPVVATRESLAGDPERAAAFDRDLMAFANRANAGEPGGQAAYRYEYLLVLAHPS